MSVDGGIIAKDNSTYDLNTTFSQYAVKILDILEKLRAFSWVGIANV